MEVAEVKLSRTARSLSGRPCEARKILLRDLHATSAFLRVKTAVERAKARTFVARMTVSRRVC
jgi:hypothetical protein